MVHKKRYLEGKVTSDIGRAVYDADCLDKLGNMGVVQFFAKKALRRQFLDDDVMVRTSIELTYAHHAPDTLKTATGRSLARKRKIRTRAFYEGMHDPTQKIWSTIPERFRWTDPMVESEDRLIFRAGTSF